MVLPISLVPKSSLILSSRSSSAKRVELANYQFKRAPEFGIMERILLNDRAELKAL